MTTPEADLEQVVLTLIASQRTFEYGRTVLGNFGILQVRAGKMLADYSDPQHNIFLRNGERFLEVHLNPPEGVTYGARLPEIIGDSLTKLAKFIQEEHLEDRPIIGFTKEATANLVIRNGFISTLQVPPERAAVVDLVYHLHPALEGTDRGRTVMVYQTGANLLSNPRIAARMQQSAPVRG